MPKHEHPLDELDGDYIQFQTAVLRQLPRPNVIDPDQRKAWLADQNALREALHTILVPAKKTVNAVAGQTEEDFEVEVVVHNRHITSRMMQQGLMNGGRASINQLIDKMGYGISSGKQNRSAKEMEIRAIIGLKMLPVEIDGSWKPTALEITTALESNPDDLFPGPLKHRALGKTATVMTASVGKPLRLTIMS